MGKKKTIENCVGTVTVSTRIQNGAVTTTYQFSDRCRIFYFLYFKDMASGQRNT